MLTAKQTKAKYAAKRPHQLKTGTRSERRAAVASDRLKLRASVKLRRAYGLQSWAGFSLVDIKYFAKDALEQGLLTKRQAKLLGYARRWH